jgi:hypothetical protein
LAKDLAERIERECARECGVTPPLADADQP